MAAKKVVGAPAWIVTFADLMSLLVCFFVLIISFSVPDIQKLKIIAGSIRDAFGITADVRVTGIVEIDGSPRFKYARDLVPLQIENVVGPVPDTGREMNRLAVREQIWQELLEQDEDEREHEDEELEETEAETEAKRFEAVEQQLRQAIQSVPELAPLAEHLQVEKAPEGLRIQLVDQTRMSMFPLGSARMYEPTRQLLAKVASIIEPLPNKVTIAGHTDSLSFRRRAGYDNWSLSLDRADATRRVLLEAGLARSRIAAVIGKADTDHIIADDPTDPRNRRISITVLSDEDALTESPPIAAPRSAAAAKAQGGASRSPHPSSS